MKFFSFLIIILIGIFFCYKEISLYAQNKGEIIIDNKLEKKEESKNREVLKTEEKIEKKQSKTIENEAGFRKKLFIVYILIFICLIYLLITYRKKIKRL